MSENKAPLYISVLFTVILAVTSALFFYKNQELQKTTEQNQKIITEKDKSIASLKKVVDKFTQVKNSEVKLSINKLDSIPADLSIFKASPESCVVKGKECLAFNFVNIASVVDDNGNKKNYLIAFLKEGKNLKVYISHMRFSPEAISQGSTLSMPDVKSFVIPAGAL